MNLFIKNTGLCLVLLGAAFGTSITNAKTANMALKNYIRADVGYSYVGKKFSSDYAKKFDDAFVGSIGAGYIVNSKFKTDMTITYRGQYKLSQNYTNGGDSYNSKQNISSIAVMLNGYLTSKGFMDSYSKNFDRFDPYLMLGIGLAVNKAGDIVATSPTAATQRTLGNQKRNFAWQIGIGSLFELTSCMAMDAMYKYVDLGDVKTHSLKKVGAVNHGNAKPVKARLRFHEFSLGINFKF